MGTHLAIEVQSEAYWLAVEHNPLTQPERDVLVCMALHARDRDGPKLAARIYVGGWRLLAFYGLCRPIYNASTKRQLARAISGLKKRGLIRDAEDQGGGHQRYEILPRGVVRETTGGVV